MKLSNSDNKLLTALDYPFILVFAFIIVFTLYPLLMLCTFSDGTEEGTDYYLFKNEFIERYGTPKRFCITVWKICEEQSQDGIQEMKESWPIFIAIAIFAFLPLVVSLIFGWC